MPFTQIQPLPISAIIMGLTLNGRPSDWLSENGHSNPILANIWRDAMAALNLTGLIWHLFTRIVCLIHGHSGIYHDHSFMIIPYNIASKISIKLIDYQLDYQ
jgi:hypothetical protein